MLSLSNIHVWHLRLLQYPFYCKFIPIVLTEEITRLQVGRLKYSLSMLNILSVAKKSRQYTEKQFVVCRTVERIIMFYSVGWLSQKVPLSKLATIKMRIKSISRSVILTTQNKQFFLQFSVTYYLLSLSLLINRVFCSSVIFSTYHKCLGLSNDQLCNEMELFDACSKLPSCHLWNLAGHRDHLQPIVGFKLLFTW